MTADLILIAGLLFLLWWLLISKPARFPPGPIKWPIVGNLYHLYKWGPYLYKSMGEMKRRYGDVVGFFVGPRPIVLVSGLDAIKELSFKDDFTGRPTAIAHKILGRKIGLLFMEGENWKEQRRFTLRHLRDFGFGKASMESITIEEVESVFAGLDGLSNVASTEWSEPVVVHDILGTATINVLWHIMAGQRYSFSDTYLKKLMGYVKKIVAGHETGPKLELAFPNLAVHFPFLSNVYKLLEYRMELLAFIEDEVKRHKSILDRENPRDFIDSYLIEVEKQCSEANTSFTESQLIHIAMDLFVAGYDTTFNTITFSLLFMILHPHVQRKVQEELDNVIGKDRLPSFLDMDRLPYTQATLQEVYRFRTTVPMSVPHAPLLAQKDMEFRGYVIPKDSQIFLNLYGLHHNPKIWGDPENFRPERFLDIQGKVIRHEALIPFGIGKRACLGESLARKNVYLFFACLMQRYNMRVPEGEDAPSDEPVGNITIVSKPFRVQVHLRK